MPLSSWLNGVMPPKIRELEADLRRAGFSKAPGKGSHRLYKRGPTKVTMSGNPGADAKPYQERQVADAIARK